MYIFIYFIVVFSFFFNDTATTEIYTLSLHDALPIYEYHIAGTFQITSWDAGWWGNCAHLVGCDTKVIIPFAVDWKTDNYCNSSGDLIHNFYDESSYLTSEGPFIIDWDFDDGNTISTGQMGLMQSHQYLNPGTYTVTLTITDANEIGRASCRERV